MAQVPDRRNLALGRCVLNGLDARPVVAPSAKIDDRPANGFAHHADAKVHGCGEIAFEMTVVARRHDIILSLAVLPDEGRALEPAHEEGREDRLSGRSV